MSKHPNKSQQIVLYLIFFVLLVGVVFSLLHFFLLKTVPVLEFLISINFASFLLFGVDKSMASFNAPKDEENFGERSKSIMPRLPEMFFYLIALLGGSAGILIGSNVFRHKTRKVSFTGKICLILSLQILWIYIVWGR